jgi:farnesyl diphosphate synthase
MAFAQVLQARAAAIEHHLEALLAGPRVAGAPERLVAAMRHAVLGGGKRLRPLLVIECAGLFGMPVAQAIETASAIECLHCYSLVHDDLPAMDDDDLRRGRPTVHKAFDEATAILAGDALLTLAFEMLASPEAHTDTERRAELVSGLARAAGVIGMVGGQTLDLAAEAEPGTTQDIGAITRIQSLKTGALITFACEAGGILGGAIADERAALARYGRTQGLAFQIADDLLDAEGDATKMGKAARKDAGRGKATFVSLLGIDGARRRLGELEAEAIAALAPFGERAGVLIDAARFVARREH